MEYEYITAGAAANRENVDATKAAKTLETLTRRVAMITPKPKPVTEDTVPRDETPPCESPTAIAERSKKRSRSMIQRLLASYIWRNRGVPSETINPPPSTVPTATEPCD